jgi:hypothetical protein
MRAGIVTAAIALLALAGPAVAGELSGVVTDSDGEVMSYVIVRVIPVDMSGGYRKLQAETDGTGTFRITHDWEGEHWIQLQKVEQGDSFVVRALKVDLADKNQKVEIKLTKTELCGKVTLADKGKAAPERPMISVTLHELVKTRDGSLTIGASCGSAYPDKKGSYRVRGIPAGKFRVYANLRGYRKFEKDIEIKKGTKKKLDVKLEPMKAGTVRFHVMDTKGRALDGVRFSYDRGGGISSTLGVDRSDDPQPGVYVISKQLEAGRWRVYVSRDGYQTARVMVKVAEGKTTEMTVELEEK